jgi:hypothetical protein
MVIDTTKIPIKFRIVIISFGGEDNMEVLKTT